MKATYKPQEGSFAYQVIQYLTTNPEDDLTPDEASIKFDKPSKQVHSLLAPAVDAGVLIRTENEDGLLYRLGAGVPSINPAPGRHASLRTDPGVIATPPHAPRKSLSRDIDPAAIAIDDGVPMPSIRRVMDWMPLLGRMKPGQSCLLPIATRATLTKAMKDAKDAKRGEWAIRKLNDDELRVWRVR